MAKVDEASRANAKRAAARAAVALNDAAAVLAGAAALCVPIPPCAVVLAVASAVAWAMANEYQGLANDPARKDSNKVNITQITSVSFGTAPTEIVRQWSVYQLQAVDAMRDLVTSLERHDGALKASPAERHPGREVAMQLEAIRHNSDTVVVLNRAALTVSARINLYWLQEAATTNNIGTVPTIEQVRGTYRTYVPGGLASLRATLGIRAEPDPVSEIVRTLSDDTVQLPPSQHPIFRQDYKPKVIDLPLGSDVDSALLEISEVLPKLVV